MSDYILREVRKALDRPTRQEVPDRLRERAIPKLRSDAAAVIRTERHSR